jgi:hypothetical protein
MAQEEISMNLKQYDEDSQGWFSNLSHISLAASGETLKIL